MKLENIGRITTTIIFFITGGVWLVLSFIYLPTWLIYLQLLCTILLCFLGWFLGNKYDKFKFLSVHDALTNAYNHNYIYEVFPKLISTVKKDQSVLSVMLIDLDDLKKINDSDGHQKGDDLLKQFSNLILCNIRQSDVFVRWGGDEFVIIAPFMNAEKMNRMIERIYTLQQSIQMHFSYGISCYPDDGRELDELIIVADERLYQMKKNKR